MFTGIVEAIGHVLARDNDENGAQLKIATGELLLSDVKNGDSIAVNGVCLTVIQQLTHCFVADLSVETLSKTTLGALDLNSLVNLEKAMLPTTRMGGHIVSGHVDGVGIISQIKEAGDCYFFEITAPENLAQYIAKKGSITVEGISLTVNDVYNNNFNLMLIPHTLENTNARTWKEGASVNIEIDIVARYVERLLSASVK